MRPWSGFWKVGDEWIHAPTVMQDLDRNCGVVVMRWGETSSVWNDPNHIADEDAFVDLGLWTGGEAGKSGKYGALDWFVVGAALAFAAWLVLA